MISSRAAAQSIFYATERQYPREASFAHLTRKRRRNSPRPVMAGFLTMLGASDDTAYRRETKSAPAFGKKIRSWPDVPSSFQEMQ